MMASRNIRALMEEGAIDRAVDAAFVEAVRRHRLHRVPISVRKDGKIVQVDPFDIALPEDDAREPHAAD
jgi:hypothetical protein